MKYLEIETKYRADDINLDRFVDFCTEKGPSEHVMASGWDHFYRNDRFLGFARHRIGPDFNQLTYKRKTSEKDNFIREEDNLDLAMYTSRPQIESFLGKMGHKHARSIFKNCFIYKFPLYTMVYYVIYNESIREIGRFIEIEMKEDHSWKSADVAWEALVELERECKPLGIIAQARMRKSLYELVCE